MNKTLAKFWAVIVFALIILLLFIGLLSCTTTKYIDREITKVDSSVVEQNENLQRTLQETIQNYESRIESINKTGIVFDTLYRDTGSVVISKVTFFDNGKIKSAEGRIKSISLDLQDKESELLDANNTIDDLSVKLEQSEARVNKVQTITKIEKHKVFPWYIFLLLPAGLFIEYRFKLIQRFLKFVKYYA